MHDFPHHYAVTASMNPDAHVSLTSKGLGALESAAPSEFGGPGDKWSPETLLVAAVADCFALSFRAIARASRFDWQALECQVDGTLDRQDGSTQFTAFTVRATLTVAQGTDEARARKLLDKAEHSCLITNSLKAAATLDTTIRYSRLE